ncbi:unnamed protein product [Caenorhabditis bovis]|uniref:Uncharacterized protein n=1 Tax=Caenorhabditis bovis TaxID=2654633 RepID=A0A8S1EE20_9PELO|nr:unnamed protein product [Caenorhabditis bovis]
MSRIINDVVLHNICLHSDPDTISALQRTCYVNNQLIKQHRYMYSKIQCKTIFFDFKPAENEKSIRTFFNEPWRQNNKITLHEKTEFQQALYTLQPEWFVCNVHEWLLSLHQKWWKGVMKIEFVLNQNETIENYLHLLRSCCFFRLETERIVRMDPILENMKALIHLKLSNGLSGSMICTPNTIKLMVEKSKIGNGIEETLVHNTNDYLFSAEEIAYFVKNAKFAKPRPTFLRACVTFGAVCCRPDDIREELKDFDNVTYGAKYSYFCLWKGDFELVLTIDKFFTKDSNGELVQLNFI